MSTDRGGRGVFALAAILSLTALCVATPAMSAANYVERPPRQYQRQATVTVHFVEDVQAACEAWGAKTGVSACANPLTNAIVVPISCLYRGELADLICHEVAHLLGWRHRSPLMIDMPLAEGKPRF